MVRFLVHTIVQNGLSRLGAILAGMLVEIGNAYAQSTVYPWTPIELLQHEGRQRDDSTEVR